MYYIGYKCSNCLHEYLAKIPKGTEAPARLHCPNCGLFTLAKRESKAIASPMGTYEVDGMTLKRTE